LRHVTLVDASCFCAVGCNSAAYCSGWGSGVSPSGGLRYAKPPYVVGVWLTPVREWRWSGWVWRISRRDGAPTWECQGFRAGGWCG